MYEHWLFISFLAPVLWSVVYVIDVYFVDKIYRDEYDGVIVSGLFQILPWMFIPFWVDMPMSAIVRVSSGVVYGIDGTLWISFLAGILYSSASYFYFKALFHHNDATMVQILWSLTIIIVPLLSLFFFGEVLSAMDYSGMMLVLSGVVLISLHPTLGQKISKKYLGIMLGAVVTLSFAMIVERYAFGSLEEVYGTTGFWYGFLFFSFGAFSFGTLLAVFIRRNPIFLIRRYAEWFLLIEGIYFVGVLFSQRAVYIAPSVSYVAVIETFEPVFTLFYSFFILGIFWILGKRGNTVEKVYTEQIEGFWMKVMAIVIMAMGVYIID